MSVRQNCSNICRIIVDIFSKQSLHIFIVATNRDQRVSESIPNFTKRRQSFNNGSLFWILNDNVYYKTQNLICLYFVNADLCKTLNDISKYKIHIRYLFQLYDFSQSLLPFIKYNISIMIVTIIERVDTIVQCYSFCFISCYLFSILCDQNIQHLKNIWNMS